MSDEDRVNEIGRMVASMLDGLLVTDTTRALIANISCGMCTVARDEEHLERLSHLAKVLLDQQIRKDWPKIKELKKTGGTSNFLSTSETRN
jgi:hypothetical protein